MRYFILLSSVFFLQAPLSAQKVRDVTKWDLKLEKVDATTFDLVANVTVEPGWYVYSRFLAQDEGPIPTSFTLEDGVRVLSRKEEGNKHEAFDPIFEMEVVKFSEQVTFLTRVRPLAGSRKLKGTYIFMACDDTKCLPPIEQPFELDLP